MRELLSSLDRRSPRVRSASAPWERRIPSWGSLALVLAIGCAHSSTNGTTGDADTGSGGSDAPVSSADAAVDAMLKGFGEPCSDSMQCQSDICVLVGTGGVCTQLCGQ